MKARVPGLLLAIATVVSLTSSPVGANVIKAKDGRDTKGPLDLAGVRISHDGNSHVFQLWTHDRFSDRDVNGSNGFFQLGIDTNADRKMNDLIDVFFSGGRFRGALLKPDGEVITDSLRASRVTSSAVKVELPLSDIVQKGSYDVAVFSIYRASPCSKQTPCVDVLPNRYPLIRHDFTPPTATWGNVPVSSTDVSARLHFPVTFHVRDDVYGSGIGSWTLQARQPDAKWQVVGSGTTRSPSVSVAGQQGEILSFRILATDRQGNKTHHNSKGTTSVPWDDSNLSAFSYTSATQNTGQAGAFLGTTSSIANTGTATFLPPVGLVDAWSQVCVLGGPVEGSVATTASAWLSVDGDSYEMTESETTPSRASLMCVPIYGHRTLSLLITSVSDEPFVLDGIVNTP